MKSSASRSDISLFLVWADLLSDCCIVNTPPCTESLLHLPKTGLHTAHLLVHVSYREHVGKPAESHMAAGKRRLQKQPQCVTSALFGYMLQDTGQQNTVT